MMQEILQVILFLFLLIILSPIIGQYIALIIKGDIVRKFKPAEIFEKFIFNRLKINPFEEMDWKKYTINLLLFNLTGLFFLFIILIFQKQLPLNPQGFSNVEWTLALNTAISFVTNTNWQSYAGETTLSYFVQMTGLTVQNFLSAATGMVVLYVIARGVVRKQSATIGNFWIDLFRTVFYILLPLSFIFALFLVGQGVIQNFSPYKEITTIEGGKQIIPMGPTASQTAIKQLGTNGGGFFNANSSFPLENPTPLSNFFEMLAILLIPASLVFTYGHLTGAKRHAWTIFGVMLFIFISGLIVSIFAEYSVNPVFNQGALMEGKETRFGVMNSVIWSAATTAASNGSVNAMQSSLSHISVLITLFNIQSGEVIFGGVGSGMYGMILFILIAVFITGLMVGRSPEYLGKKIDSFEIKLTIIAIIFPNLVILLFTSLALELKTGLAGLSSFGSHGFTEVLYAFSSAAGNNGSAFAGLNANTPFYNLTMALGMLIGRFGVLIPVMAISGNLANKNTVPPSLGTLKTDTLLFALLLVGIIIIVGALTFFPALSLGPVMEHFLMQNGTTF